MNIAKVTKSVIENDTKYFLNLSRILLFFVVSQVGILAFRLTSDDTFFFYEKIIGIGFAIFGIASLAFIFHMKRNSKRFFTFSKIALNFALLGIFFVITPFGMIDYGLFYAGGIVFFLVLVGGLVFSLDFMSIERTQATQDVLNLYYLVFVYMVQKYGLIKTLKSHGMTNPEIETFITEDFSGEGSTTYTYNKLYARDGESLRVDADSVHPLDDPSYHKNIETLNDALFTIVRSFQRFNTITDDLKEADPRIVWNDKNISEELNNLQFHNVSLLYREIDFDQTGETKALMKAVDDILNYSRGH